MSNLYSFNFNETIAINDDPKGIFNLYSKVDIKYKSISNFDLFRILDFFVPTPIFFNKFEISIKILNEKNKSLIVILFI